MHEKLELVVQSFLHPTEVVKIALEAKAIRSSLLVDNDASEAESTHSLTGEIRGLERILDAPSDKKILAVVSHLDSNARGTEQGCVFILKCKHHIHRPHAVHIDYSLERLYPVIGGFSISVSQSRRNTLDLRATMRPTALAQPRSELSLTINPHDTTLEPVSLVAYDTEGLRTLLAECRKLKDVSPAPPAMDDLSDEIPVYHWLTPYMARSTQPPLFSLIPPDLRTLKKPVHTLLSPASAGLPGDEASDIAVIREDWMRRRVKDDLIANCEKFSQIRIRVCTFNVDGKMPTQDLSPWIGGRISDKGMIPPLAKISPFSIEEIAHNPFEQTGLNSGENVKENIPEEASDPDLFVLAFQELDNSTEALLYSTKTVREDAWRNAAFSALGDKAIFYEKLASKQLVGILLILIVKKDIRSSFKDIKTAYIGAGIMGMMGNKGAVALRMAYIAPASSIDDEWRPTILTFVNSHLAAFDEMYDRRNADFHDISKRLVFDSGIPSSIVSSQESGDMPLSVFDTDALFWMGDLNYRINLPDVDVRALLSSPQEIIHQDIGLLFTHDQLLLAQRTRKAFEGFKEHPMYHPPTYRFSAGVVTDALGYDLKRKPAWTDRVLHMHSAMLTIKQLTYTSHPEVTISDHKPVSADFKVSVPSIGTAAHDSFINRIWQDVAAIEDLEGAPKVRLSDTTIDFGPVYYRRRCVRSLIVENIGELPCTYRIVGTDVESPILPRWLMVEGMTGLVLPGHRATLTLSCYIDDISAAGLNIIAKTQLQQMLILHTVLGKDHFITVSGNYQRTCLATDLEWLARLPSSIRALGDLNDLLPVNRAATTPREIMRLVKWLMSNATDVDGLFVQHGEEVLMEAIRECLDTGAEFEFRVSEKDTSLALAFADTLLRLLAVLPKSLFPIALHFRCTQVTSKEEAFELLEQLPSVSLNVWISVTAVLHYITQQASSPLKIEQLIAVFTPVLLRDTPTAATSASIVGKRKFLRYFIA